MNLLHTNASGWVSLGLWVFYAPIFVFNILMVTLKFMFIEGRDPAILAFAYI